MRLLLLGLAWLASGWDFGASAAGAERQTERPNVLLLLTDDQRPDTIAALGNRSIRTPHLDRMVREGTAFTRAITAIPICVASRAELLTGRNGLANGRGDFGFMPAPDVPHWARVMRDAGYETCYVGKWHTPGRPSDSGYSRTEGLYAGGRRGLTQTHPRDWSGREVTGYLGWVFQTDDGERFLEHGVGLTPDISSHFADAAIQFLREPRDRPFFLHVNFTAPHDPLLLPPGDDWKHTPESIPLPKNFAKEHPFDHGNAGGRDELLFRRPRSPEETRGELAAYYAVISHLDAQVGRILKALEELKQLDRTLIVLTSDHGLAIGSHGLRGKQNMYDHTISVPLVMRGPSIPRDRRTPAQCYLRDLMPTVCDLAGIPVPASVQGKSLRPILDGSRDAVYADVFAHFRDSQRMIRTAEWKYIVYPQVRREQLFDLKRDPDEQENLIDDPTRRDQLAGLRARLDAWRRENGDITLAPH